MSIDNKIEIPMTHPSQTRLIVSSEFVCVLLILELSAVGDGSVVGERTVLEIGVCAELNELLLLLFGVEVADGSDCWLPLPELTEVIAGVDD